MKRTIVGLLALGFFVTACSTDSDDTRETSSAAVTTVTTVVTAPTTNSTAAPSTSSEAPTSTAGTFKDALTDIGITDPAQVHLIDWWGDMACQFLGNGSVTEAQMFEDPAGDMAESGITVTPEQGQAIGEAILQYKCEE